MPGSDGAGTLEAAGFGVRRLYEEELRMLYVDGAALLDHFLTRIGFLEAWKKVVDAGDEQRVFALLERKLDEKAGREGELRMTIPMLYIEAE